MTVKELKKKINALPKTLDEAEVYAYSSTDEGGDHVSSVKVYDQSTFDDNHGTPYCKGDKPWEYNRVTKEWGWKGSPAFVVIG